ncbi:MAG: hypothetical protein HUU43_05195 [Ignavibacteriaceae bacterium]|nr:hypothetical protein [Ignavibacteriaceae bacterium]NUM70221.1 hypothetical protein [Ignavibacteriaceae bacterium]
MDRAEILQYVLYSSVFLGAMMFLSIAYIFFEKTNRKKAEREAELNNYTEPPVLIIVHEEETAEQPEDEGEYISEENTFPDESSDDPGFIRAAFMDVVSKEMIYNDISKTKIKRAWH